MLTPLRQRDFRWLWTGMTVSLVGDGVFLVALAWQVYQLSNVPTALSIVSLAMSVPHVVLLLFGGVISDRFPRRNVMLLADVIRGLAVVAIGVLSIGGLLEIWHLVVLAAAYGAGTAFFGPAFDAIVPDLVPGRMLSEANALDQFVRPAAFRMAGPALGGVLIAASGPGGAFLLDGATFAVSAAALLRMRTRAPAMTGADHGEREPASAIGEIREGFRFVRRHVWLWGTFLAATLAYLLFMGPSEVLLPFVVKNRLGGSPADLGYVFAMGGVGAIGAALVMGQRGQPRRYITFMYLAWTVATFAIAGYGLATLPWHAMAASLVFNAMETAGTVVWATTKHRLVPGRLLGRVSSFDWFISIALLPVSFALTGPLAAVLGAETVLVGAGVLGGLITFAFLFLPGMRAVERAHPVDAGVDEPGAAVPVRAALADETVTIA